MDGHAANLMNEGNSRDELVFRFLMEHVDTVPHMEALLLLWKSRPRVWKERELASRLYISAGKTKAILHDLIRHNLVITAREKEQEYRYGSGSEETDRVMADIAELYGRDLVRLTTFIHAKGSSGVREFAKAFKFTKERE